MAFPSSPANNAVHTAGGRSWRWDQARGVWQPLLGWSPANELMITQISSGNQTLTATNTQQALQQIFGRAVDAGMGPEQPTGTYPQGPAGETVSRTGADFTNVSVGGRWQRYSTSSQETQLFLNQTTTPMPPGWSTGMPGPALMTDSTARMVTSDHWNNVAVQGVQTQWRTPLSVTMPAGPLTVGCWTWPRPGGQLRFADMWVWGYAHNIQFVWNTADGTMPRPAPNTAPPLGPNGQGPETSTPGGTTINAYGVYRMPGGWTFGWVQMTTTWAIEGVSMCQADRFTNGTPGMQFWPGSPATSGLYLYRFYLSPGLVSVPGLLG